MRSSLHSVTAACVLSLAIVSFMPAASAEPRDEVAAAAAAWAQALGQEGAPPV